MTPEPKPRSRWVYVSIALIVLVIALIGSFSYVLLDMQRNVSVLQNEQASIETSIEHLRATLGQPQTASQATTGLTPAQIYDLSKDSVVQITAKERTYSGLEPFSSGSGFVYDKGGHLVTNNHVVEYADAIEVTFRDGTVVPAELVGTDLYSDLAVIRVA